MSCSLRAATVSATLLSDAVVALVLIWISMSVASRVSLPSSFFHQNVGKNRKGMAFFDDAAKPTAGVRGSDREGL